MPARANQLGESMRQFALLWFVPLLVLGTLLDAKAGAPAVELVEFDSAGRFRDTAAVDELIHSIDRLRPTHVYLLAHGWNNNRRDALKSYAAVAEIMDQVAAQHQLRPAEYVPLVIGIHWPSLAWDDEEEDEDLTMQICQALPAEQHPESHLQDVMDMKELLESDDGMQQQHQEEAMQIMSRYALQGNPQEECIFGQAKPRKEITSVKSLFRVFSFWQMKKRARMIGRTGGHELLQRLMTAVPEAKFHVGGHSFGAELWLSALDEGPIPRPLDCLILLQPAISASSFAARTLNADHAGPYYRLLNEGVVRGPIVVTFSDRDVVLKSAYPLGSLSDPEETFALGAVGAQGAEMPGKLAQMLPESKHYKFEPGLWSINGTAFIKSHGDYENREVAWLIWSAVLWDVGDAG